MSKLARSSKYVGGYVGGEASKLDCFSASKQASKYVSKSTSTPNPQLDPTLRSSTGRADRLSELRLYLDTKSM